MTRESGTWENGKISTDVKPRIALQMLQNQRKLSQYRTHITAGDAKRAKADLNARHHKLLSFTDTQSGFKRYNSWACFLWPSKSPEDPLLKPEIVPS